MRIDSLTLRNFKCFSELHLDMHPEFNVLLGINGTGKTSILEALRVAIGSLYLGLDKYKNRIEVPSIANDDIRLEHLEQQFPTEVSAQGTFESLGTSFEPHSHVWMRSVETRGGKTRYGNATQILNYGRLLQKSVRAGEPVNIPLLAYFSTDRYKKEKTIAENISNRYSFARVL